MAATLMYLVLLLNCIFFIMESFAIDFYKNSGSKSSRPNVVVFLVDDLGIGDIGCFGNTTIKTPNIDSLAAQGAKLNHNLSPESICTPSRAAMLTGRYAIRSGLAAAPNELRIITNLACNAGLPENETTFAKVLQENGYQTGLIGKWHLGLHCKEQENCHHPKNMGFDEFYGLPLTNLRDCGPLSEGSSLLHIMQGSIRRLFVALSLLTVGTFLIGLFSRKSLVFFIVINALLVLVIPFVIQSVFARSVCVVMRDFDIVEQPMQLENLTVRFTNEAKNFVKRNKNGPFLLFFSFAKVHAVLFSSPRFKGHSKHGRYGDNVEEMDWSVGEIIKTLEKENLLDNTFVYFTSDHGPFLEIKLPSGEKLGGSSGKYKGGKAQTWEGGIRVPTIAMWRNRIPNGITINEATNGMDLFATIIELAGGRTLQDRHIDGRNILPLLMRKETVSPHEFMFHYCGNAIHAARYRPRHGNNTWKAHFHTPLWRDGYQTCDEKYVMCPCFGEDVVRHDPPLLYDITNDPYEMYQLDTNLEAHKTIIAKIKNAVDIHRRSILPVPKQLGYPNAWPTNIHRQPCCNIPYCKCFE